MRYPPKVAMLDNYESTATLCVSKILGGCAERVNGEVESSGRAWVGGGRNIEGAAVVGFWAWSCLFAQHWSLKILTVLAGGE